MKKFLLILCLLSSNFIYAQVTEQDKAFLNWFFKEARTIKPGQIYYLREIWPGTIEEMKLLLKPDTLKTLWNRDGNAENLVLTKEEHGFINKEIDHFRSLHFQDHLLPDIRIIEQDTLDRYFKKGNFLNGWQELYKRNIHGYYSFTKPIFLRNNTICIFEYGYSCGFLCGDGATNIYKKENGKWKLWINLSNWVS